MLNIPHRLGRYSDRLSLYVQFVSKNLSSAVKENPILFCEVDERHRHAVLLKDLTAENKYDGGGT